MSKTPLTSLVGKPNPKTGGWSILRPLNGSERLKEFENSGEMTNIRVRDIVKTPEQISGSVLTSVQQYLEQAKNGSIKVIISYGNPDRHTGRYQNITAREYKIGETYSVAPFEALRLLNTFPLSFLFEASEDEGNSSVFDDSLEGQNRMLRERLEKMEAMLEQQISIMSQQNQSGKKKSLKDLED